MLEIASEVATLAADVAETGNRNLEGDALAGSLLAEAAARSAATLAQLNVSMLSRHAIVDAHLEKLRPALARATRARERAVRPTPPSRSQVLLEPGEDPLGAVDPPVGPGQVAHPVRALREEHVLDLALERSQRDEQLLVVGRRAAQVGLALEDQERRA